MATKRSWQETAGRDPNPCMLLVRLHTEAPPRYGSTWKLPPPRQCYIEIPLQLAYFVLGSRYLLEQGAACSSCSALCDITPTTTFLTFLSPAERARCHKRQNRRCALAGTLNHHIAFATSPTALPPKDPSHRRTRDHFRHSCCSASRRPPFKDKTLDSDWIGSITTHPRRYRKPCLARQAESKPSLWPVTRQPTMGRRQAT